MADKRDYYEVLGVGRSAAEDEIKRAYRQLARKYHPDVNKDADAETRFKELTEAYEVLGDAQRRQMYDRFGHDVPGGTRGAGGEGFPFGDIGDLFESFFGGAQATRRGPQRGADLRMRVDLTFEEAVFGVEKKVDLARWESCLICGGSGAEPGKAPITCVQCGGTGEVRRIQQSIFGQFVNVATCDRCRGQGTIVKSKCHECGGSGRLNRQRQVTLPVPAGVDDGTEMRVAGEGEGGDKGGPSGNLYVQFHVQPHPVLRRDGIDLIYELPLNVAEAALGAEHRVPTLEGEEVLTVPPGTQHGRVFRIREKGVPRLQRAGRGDFRVVVNVQVPKSLTARQRELFGALAESLAGRDRSGDTSDGAQPELAGAAAGAADRTNGRAGRRGRKKERGLFGKVKDALGLDESDA
ncbi:MAG: molecular chaperone DnaJ [Chloroflexota bacterium]|nr:molecular chaperone DnaJ [Chloroflexota bacterium]